MPGKKDETLPPRLLTMDEVASPLRGSRGQLRQVFAQHPFYRAIGRSKVFASEDYDNLVEASSYQPRHAATRIPAPPSMVALWKKAHELAGEEASKRRKRRSR